MGKFVAIHVLKQYNPGTFNRGENGEAKQIIVGGVNRVRFSSQCQKRAIREIMAPDEIRTAHIEKLISKILDVRVADGTITEEEKDLIGSLICSKEVIGTKCWDKLKKKDEQDSVKDLQGNIVVNTNGAEINALVNTFIDELKTNGKDELKKNYKKIAENAALTDVNISIAKSLFGTMATDGVLGTVDGALQMGQAFSVDEYMPESDFFTVKFTGRAGVDTSDPFFGAYTEFNDIESNKQNGETINNGLALYSNLIYEYANINIKELERNLNTFVSPRKYTPNDTTVDTILKVVPDFIKAMIEMVPEATQNRSSSHVEPAAVLIEVIEDGANIQPDWSKVISNTNISISEQAINRLAKFANNKTFRSGNIKQYILLGSDYTEFSNKFTDAKVINSFNELTDVIKNDVKPLI